MTVYLHPQKTFPAKSHPVSPILRKEAEKNNPVNIAEKISADRLPVLDRVIDKLYGNGAKVKGKHLEIVMGMPGSGKSTEIFNKNKLHNSLVIDASTARKEIVKESFDTIRPEGVYVREKLFEKGLQNGDALIYETVGSNIAQLKNVIQQAENAGYQVKVHFVETPVKQAKMNALHRYLENPLVYEYEGLIKYIEYAGKVLSKNYEALAKNIKGHRYTVLR